MESYARCKTPVSGTSVNIKELQTTEKRWTSQRNSVMLYDLPNHHKDSLQNPKEWVFYESHQFG
ncbi:hypothetical protein T07_12038 [Trichinella nelsoni]|uniref:Uncharacterized protein n=1 Tax=Trichinella nelsoni TaxID=6336 RepID=A0A0V0RBB8_9BILA|nr:hypothetical protein T07_12038 [Trichinella nelsoni]